MHIHNKINILSPFSPTRFGAYCATFREHFYFMFKTTVKLCDYTRLKLLYSHMKDHVCFNVELKTLKSLCKTHLKLF